MKPTLYVSRILLRTIENTDSDDLFEIYADTHTMEFASDPVFSSSSMVVQMLDSVARLEQSGESLEWAIVERQTSKVIGTCGLHSFSSDGQGCEVGCLLNSTYWRQGFMTEALGLLFNYAKSVGISVLYADIDKSNLRSQALFKKLGFEPGKGGLVYAFQTEL